MDHAVSSGATATGDTVKTLIETITVPATAKRIKAIWGYCVGAAAVTTGEQASGILEVESSDINVQPLQVPLDIVGALTSGAFSLKPTLFPLDIPVTGKERLSGYMTMDVAQTGGFKGRWGFIYGD